jgi:hypothetical protein
VETELIEAHGRNRLPGRTVLCMLLLIFLTSDGSSAFGESNGFVADGATVYEDASGDRVTNRFSVSFAECRWLIRIESEPTLTSAFLARERGFDGTNFYALDIFKPGSSAGGVGIHANSVGSVLRITTTNTVLSGECPEVLPIWLGFCGGCVFSNVGAAFAPIPLPQIILDHGSRFPWRVHRLEPLGAARGALSAFVACSYSESLGRFVNHHAGYEELSYHVASTTNVNGFLLPSSFGLEYKGVIGKSQSLATFQVMHVGGIIRDVRLLRFPASFRPDLRQDTFVAADSRFATDPKSPPAYFLQGKIPDPSDPNIGSYVASQVESESSQTFAARRLPGWVVATFALTSLAVVFVILRKLTKFHHRKEKSP